MDDPLTAIGAVKFLETICETSVGLLATSLRSVCWVALCANMMNKSIAFQQRGGGRYNGNGDGLCR